MRGTGYLLGIVDLQIIDSGLLIVNDILWVGQNGIAYLSLLIIYVCLKRGKISLLRPVLQIFPHV